MRTMPRVNLSLAAMAVLVALAVSPTASAHSNGQWASARIVQAALVGKVYDAIVCGPSGCSFVPSTGYTRGYLPVKVEVIAAKATGVGKSRMVNGARRFQHFDVRACARDYQQGGAHVALRMLWHTKRPPTTAVVMVNGTKVTHSDTGAAFGEDWTNRGLTPIIGKTGSC